MPPRSAGNKTHTEQRMKEDNFIFKYLIFLYFCNFKRFSYVLLYASPQAYKSRYGYYFLLNWLKNESSVFILI